jgi:hypothetical protein
LIRFLQPRYKRKVEAAINVGDEQVAPFKVGQSTFFPDLVLTSGKKFAGVVEVETGESVNNLEAMAQWVNFARARVPFHLYVPVQSYDVARRLCEANQIRPAEVWTYRTTADGFDLVRAFHDPSAGGAASRSRKAASSPKARSKPPKKKAPPVKRATKPAKVARKSGHKR